MKPVNIVERDQDTNEKFLRVIVTDSELNEIREGMTKDVQDYEQKYKKNDKSDRDKMERKRKALEGINTCWEVMRS